MKNGYELLADFEKVLKDCIYVSNEKLPEFFRDERTDGVSLATLERKCDDLDKISEFEYTRQQKEKRIAMYADDIANGREIQYLCK